MLWRHTHAQLQNTAWIVLLDLIPSIRLIVDLRSSFWILRFCRKKKENMQTQINMLLTPSDKQKQKSHINRFYYFSAVLDRILNYWKR